MHNEQWLNLKLNYKSDSINKSKLIDRPLMEQRSSTDQKWVSYVVIIFAYTIAVVNDWLSAFLFILILLEFSGLLQRRWMFLLAQLVLIADFVLKSPFVNLDGQKFKIDKHCVYMIYSKKLKPQLFLYLIAHLYNLYLCIFYFINRNRKVHIKTWGPLMTQIMVYTMPIVMYALSLVSFYWPIKVAWAAASCLQLLDVAPSFNHFLSCILITCYFFIPQVGIQYVIQFGDRIIPQQSVNYIIEATFALIMVFQNVYSNPHPQYKQSAKKQDNLITSTRRLDKRAIKQQSSKQKTKSIVVLTLAIALCLLTTSLGNIFILFSIYANLPSFKAKRFFALLGFGVVLSVMLQPQQIPYFVYLYTTVLIVGQDITSPTIIQYQMHSYAFFLSLYRLYIMLSHVSFLNWIITIFNTSIIVTIVISIRIVCRYFNYVSVFLGTNDHYGFDTTFLNLHSLSDFVLIMYLILLRLYSVQKTKTYQSSTITNVLLQYPILQKCKRILVILRAFNWASYIIFSLIILSRRPSLYIAIHIFYLVLILICDTIREQEFPRKNWVLKNLWGINFYSTVLMIFLKYFYFLKQYQSHSELMDYLLSILTQYKFWLGLDDLTKETQGFALAKYFLYDGAVLLLSWINIYVYKFKLYYNDKNSQRRNTEQIDKQINEGLKESLLQFQNFEQMEEIEEEDYQQKGQLTTNKYLQDKKRKEERLQKKLSYELQLKRARYANIHYFYNKYIKPIDLTSYLARHEYKILEKIFRDCLLDLCFAIVVLAFYLERQKIEYIFYLPLFIISAYAYYNRFLYALNLQFTQKILGLCTAWSFVMLFSSYVYITFLQRYDQQIPTALFKMYITYILCIVLCFLYKICCCVPDRRPTEKNYHCLIYIFFPFAVQSNLLWTEMLSIFSEFWLTLTMSLFFTNIFSPPLISTFIHPVVVVYLLVKKIGRQKSQYWLYIVCLISILDIWNYDFFGYFTVLATTVFYAVKTAQKMSEEDANKGFRQDVVSASEQISENDMDSPIPDSEQKKWNYYMAYCTLIWMLPQTLSLLWMFGVVWLSPSLIATVLIVFSYGTLLYQLLSQKETQISQPLMKMTLGITIIFFCYELFEYIFNFYMPNKIPYNHSQMGLFLIFQSCFFYLTLKKRQNWFSKRSNDAKKYWTQKTELVGQLGSQLHNQKKLITLEKYYSSKERLTQKVNKISSHLKNSSQKKAYFQSLDSLLKTKQSQQGSYELYTNMLIFLDMHLLKKCFLMINQYLTAHRDENVVEKAKTIRKQIYRTYLRSFNQAFSRYKNEIQNRQQNLQQSGLRHSGNSSRASTINLQKINEINQRYKKCFQIISKSTQSFNCFFRFFIQHFQIISMMIVIGWNLFGGVYTIPTNIIIFGWAVVLENKTTVNFWVLVMSYTCIVLIFRQIIIYLPDVFIFNFIFYYHAEDYLYEFLIVMVSVLQITLIKLGGTRYKTYSERQSIYDAFYRAALNKAANGSQLDKQQSFMDIYKNLAEPDNHSFWYRVFSKSRFKPGKDFYPLMSGIQLFILLYIFFFYDMMEFQSRKNRKSIGELLTVNQFSSHMVIALFLQVVVMIIDRFIISLNLVDEDNQALQNFFLSFTFSLTQVKEPPPQKLDKVGIFDFLLVLKYLFHLTLLIIINFFVYFYIPSAGLTKSLIPSCSEAECNKSYTYLSIFLILYFTYFLVSGLQIKHGFNRNKCKNVLMEKYHYTNYYIYKMFTAIPFAWQFKKICDWTVTSTALPLFHWMKFQDINARLYESKCQAQMIKIKPLGTPWNKYFLGPLGFIAILLLAFSPFIIYSSVNPFAVKDAVIGARTDIYLKMDERYDYKFFSTSHATVTEKTQQNFQLDLTNQNLYLIKLSKYPDQNFLISQPVVNKLCEYIKQTIAKKTHKFQFVLNLNIFQQQGGESTVQWTKKQLKQVDLQNLLDLLKLKKTDIVIHKFYSPFPGELPLQSIIMRSPNYGEYFEVELNRVAQSNKQMYFYYLTSSKFKVSVGILTFYVTYILLISRLLRFYLTGSVRNIIYQGCYLESILVLCQAVREARIVENFLQEESFYFELVDIMRQPKALKQITGDFLTFRKKYI